MKRIAILGLIILMGNNVIAQKVDIRKGVVYIDDSTYCKVTGKKGLLGTMETSFSIMGLDDTELIFVNENTAKGLYEFSFLTLNEKIKIKKAEFGINWKAAIVKALFKNQVIKENTIDAIGKNRFTLKYQMDKEDMGENEKMQPKNEVGDTENKIVLIERNTDAEIFVFFESIKQDFKEIAKYSSSTSVNSNGEIVRTYKIKLPTGQLIAEFKADEFKAENNTLYIVKSDKIIKVANISGNTVGQEIEIIKKVARILIDNKSL